MRWKRYRLSIEQLDLESEYFITQPPVSCSYKMTTNRLCKVCGSVYFTILWIFKQGKCNLSGNNKTNWIERSTNHIRISIRNHRVCLSAINKELTRKENWYFDNPDKQKRFFLSLSAFFQKGLATTFIFSVFLPGYRNIHESLGGHVQRKIS